ncbi:MAG TPA: bifunctional polysaccharide deacetylase/glycosyltransferase family 2 protein [Pilimelia sp.]|nr:bifunctional polysaccharide deacetylase/glycosyltransferase family 2 protein [Pilimelia sp.]
MPSGRWILAGVVLFVLANVMLVEAYTNARFAPDALHARGSGAAVPDAIRDGGPVIDTSGAQPRSYRLPNRTIALTFDDGPDPRWTPQIARVLRAHDVRATFFVVGSQVSRHPGLVRRLAGEGHELGAHTFSHPSLPAMPEWRRNLEHSQTQMAIAYAAGVKTALLRPPYSSFASALDGPTWAHVQETGRLGYLTVLNDRDSRDWARPGVPAITRAATPEGDQGAIVLMHDAGGDRSQTVAALDRFIPMMKQRGYRFTTVSEGLRQNRENSSLVANPPATGAETWRGRALVWGVQAADALMLVLWATLIAIGALTLARMLLLFLFAVRHARGRRAVTWSWGSPVTAPVSVIVPAYNEAETIAPAVRSLAASAHPAVEVIVVDDGSTDGTGTIVNGLGLPNVRLVRVPPAGKATALNTGLGLAHHDIVVMVDADTVVTPESIHRLVQPFADPSVGAVAGNVKVGNRRRLIARWQHIEYVIGFNLDRRLYDTLRCMPTVPGALGAFRRQAVRDAGGLSHDTLAEDTDLTMALHRAGWRVVYEERAVAYTEAPANVSQLWKQRYRWSYGTMQAMWKHRRAVVESGPSGRFGRRGLPFIALFSVALPLLAPLLDILAIYGTFFLDRWATAIAWLAVLVIQILTAVLAFRLDREPLRPLWSLPLQQFCYRQVMYLVLLHSVVTAMTGGRLPWHKLRRTGEAAMAAHGRP